MVYRVLAFSGSLQKASTNSGLLRAVLQLKHPDLQIEIVDISNLPHLNPDLISKDGTFPGPVQAIREKAIKADALLLAIPEYNFRVSAPLKNAYDWLSISPNPAQIPSPLKEKVIGIISSGLNGGNQAQDHFVQIGQYCKVKVFKQQKGQFKRYQPGNFDQKGNLISEDAKHQLSEYLKDFTKYIGKNK